jgi:hypothetical protein
MPDARRGRIPVRSSIYTCNHRFQGYSAMQKPDPTLNWICLTRANAFRVWISNITQPCSELHKLAQTGQIVIAGTAT